jgi:hypothetical protein
LKIILTPTLNNKAAIYTKNSSEEIFQTHVILVKPISNKTEICNIMKARYEDLVLENDKNYRLAVPNRKKRNKINRRLKRTK